MPSGQSSDTESHPSTQKWPSDLQGVEMKETEEVVQQSALKVQSLVIEICSYFENEAKQSNKIARMFIQSLIVS